MMHFRRIPIRRQQVVLLGVDIVILFVSLPMAALLRQAGGPADLPPITLATLPANFIEVFRSWTGATLLSMVVFLGLFFVFDLYSTQRQTRSLRDLVYILFVSGLATVIVPVFYFFFPFWNVRSRGILVLQALFVGIAAFVWRLIYSKVHHVISRPRRVLVIGAGKVAMGLLEEIHRSFRNELEVVGVVDDDPAKVDVELNGYRVIGGTRDVRRLAKEKEVEILIFAIPRKNNPIDPELMADILGLKTRGLEVYQMATFFKKIAGRVPVDYVETSWLVFNQEFSAAENGPAARARDGSWTS